MVNRSLSQHMYCTCFAALAGVIFLGMCNSANGQGGVLPPTGPTNPVEPIDQGFDPNQGGGQTVEENTEPVDFEDSASLDLGGTDENNRNQGFVGATAPYVSERNFIGSASQTFGALADRSTLGEDVVPSFGGGINSNSSISIPNGGNGGGAGGFGGFQTSGNIIRRSLRSRLRPAFASPRVPTQVTVGRFNSNFARQTGTQSMSGRYQISMQNKTAFITGVVNTKADSDRLERQLRLQPGVYKIVNQLQFAQ